ncbi:hypothetical protein [Kribbella lupini]|uniref:Uncharacterized protein n=1 Tax=Kribbella lupini TaxID=291602 RepID=A0ABP4MM66_9ACTN
MSEPEVPGDAPEADVLEQYQSPAGLDAEEEPPGSLPPEADAADVEEQRRSVGDGGEDDYR